MSCDSLFADLVFFQEEGEDQHDDDQHQAEHIAVAGSRNEAFRIGGAGAHRQQAGGDGRANRAEHLLHGVKNGGAAASASHQASRIWSTASCLLSIAAGYAVRHLVHNKS